MKKVYKLLKAVLAILVVAFLGLLSWTDYKALQEPVGSYAYCSAVCTLTSRTAMVLLLALYIVMTRRLLVKRYYSVLSVFLVFTFAICAAIYFFVADVVFDYVVGVMDKKTAHNITMLSSHLYYAPMVPVLLVLAHLIPGLIKSLRGHRHILPWR